MKSVLASIQWMIFILAGSIVAPIAIGDAFQLPTFEIAGLLQRSFFVIGIGSLLQTIFGHKLPLAEGAAGLWWGVFLVLAGFGASMKIESYEILQSLEMGLLISGCLFIIMGAFGLIDQIKKIFTPMATGIYLFLLVAQLSSSFMKGIMGIGYLTPDMDSKVFLSAIAVLILTVLFSKSRYTFIRSYSILYGIIIGWLLFVVLGMTKPIDITSANIIELPKILVWGIPKFNAGVVLTSVITTLLLLSNLIASIEIVRKQVDYQTVNNNKAGFMMGINHILTGLFSAVGIVPLSISGGFIAATRLKKRSAFIIGSALITLISFFPAVTLFFASLPSPVGYAAIFVTFSNILIMAFNELSSINDSSRRQILAVSLMFGLGSMFVPSAAFKYVPGFLISILNNGMILGVIICILLEQRLIILQKKKTLHYK
jgi:xanthine/uracil permease